MLWIQARSKLHKNQVNHLQNSLQILQMKLALVELTRRFYIEPPSDPELDSWKVRETVNHIPLHNYIVMRSWKEVKF
jgi:hypothetical protein